MASSQGRRGAGLYRRPAAQRASCSSASLRSATLGACAPRRSRIRETGTPTHPARQRSSLGWKEDRQVRSRRRASRRSRHAERVAPRDAMAHTGSRREPAQRSRAIGVHGRREAVLRGARWCAQAPCASSSNGRPRSASTACGQGRHGTRWRAQIPGASSRNGRTGLRFMLACASALQCLFHKARRRRRAGWRGLPSREFGSGEERRYPGLPSATRPRSTRRAVRRAVGTGLLRADLATKPWGPSTAAQSRGGRRPQPTADA